MGTKNERELKRLAAGAEINALEPEMKELPDAEFPLRTVKAQGAPWPKGQAGRNSAGSFCHLPRSGTPHVEHAAL